MVRRLSLLAAVVAFVGLSLPTQAEAQASLYIAGGATFPTGDFGDYAKTGWMGIGGFVYEFSSGFGVGGEFFYGQNSHKDDYEIPETTFSGANFSSIAAAAASDKTNPYGFMGTINYFFQAGTAVRPYLFGGLGLIVHKYKSEEFDISESESGFGWELGAGVAYGVSESVSLFGEGRYMAGTGDVSDTKLFGLFAGVAFGL